MLDNKTVALDFIKALGKGDTEKLKNLLSADVKAICTGTCMLSTTRGLTEIIAAAGMLGQMTKSGIDFQILSVTAEEDRVSVETEGRSTLANGTAYNNQYHFLFFVRAGKIFRIKEYLDTKLVDECFQPLLAGAA